METKRQEIYREIGRLKTEYDEISDTYEIDDYLIEDAQLSKKIGKILERWDFPNGNKIAFDIDARDIQVNDKPRSHFGKGYRAICFSATLLGLMEYLCEEGRHPGFVRLDSPLTTYKKQDEDREVGDDEVVLANNLIYAFYRDLCDFL